MPRVTGSSATRSGQQHVRGVGKGEKLPPPTATSNQTTGSSTARMHQKDRLDVEDDVFASSVDGEEVTSTEEVSSDEGHDGVPGEDVTENGEEDSDDAEDDDDRSGSGSSRASDDDSVSETESDAFESSRTGAPVSNGSRSSTRGKGGSSDHLPSNFHGYACHKCGGGVGWNAKRCRKCKTPVRKPNQRRPDEPSLPQPPAADVTVTPKNMRSKRGRDPVPAADPAIPPAVAAMAAALSADPTFQAIQRASTDVSPIQTPAPVVPPAPAPLDHDDVQIVASKAGEVKVVSATGAVAHLTTQREGYSYMHSVSRSKTLPPAPVFAPLSLLDSFSVEQIDHHCRSLQAETFQRRFRPLIIRLMEHSANAGVFNAPVQPQELGILDYFTVCCIEDDLPACFARRLLALGLQVIKTPMDLGTIRQKLESGHFAAGQAGVDQLAAEVTLVFNNAMTYNPKAHPVHVAAAKLLDEFNTEFKKLTAKSEVDVKRKDAHSCGFCQGQFCRLCQDKCLRFDPPLFSCDCCMERIKRGDNYYRAPSGQRWCVRCVSNGGLNAEPGAVLPPVSVVPLFRLANQPSPPHATFHTVESILRASGIDVTSVMNAAAAVGLSVPGYEVKPPPMSDEKNKPKVMLRIRRSQSTGDAVQVTPAASPLASTIAPAKVAATPTALPTSIPVNSSTTLATLSAYPPGTKFLAVPTASLTNASTAASLLQQLQQSQRAIAAAASAPGTIPAGGAPFISSPINAVRPAAIISTPSTIPAGLEIKPRAVVSKGGKTAAASTDPYAAAASAAVAIGNTLSGPNGTLLCEQFKKAGIDPQALMSYVQALAARAGVTVPPGPVSGRLRRAHSTESQAAKTPSQVLAAMLRARLEKRRNDDVVAEPWVQCDRCAGWVHQVCAMFNARKNALLPFNAPYICPLCRKDDLLAREQHEASMRKTKRSPTTSPSATGKSSTGSTPSAGPPSDSSLFGGSPAHKLPAGEGFPADNAVLSACSDPYATASSLPHTPLSLELERRVKERMCACAGEAVAASITVRMVSSLRKTLNVPEHVRTVFTSKPPPPDALFETVSSLDALSSTSMESVSGTRQPEDGTSSHASTADSTYAERYDDQYPYRQRVILLFQNLDGVDVCLFALYVQEYGADCPAPNTNKVYIAYLDSVRYLRPLVARTAVYHELLAAYLSNARQRGYEQAYIWACPPQRGDGYIFHVHPPSQRVPGKERLREWYDECLRQLAEEGVVAGVTSLFDEFFEVNHASKMGDNELRMAPPTTSADGDLEVVVSTAGGAEDIVMTGRPLHTRPVPGSLGHLSGAASPSPVLPLSVDGLAGHPPGGGAVVSSPSLMGLHTQSAEHAGSKRRALEQQAGTPHKSPQSQSSTEGRVVKKARIGDENTVSSLPTCVLVPAVPPVPAKPVKATPSAIAAAARSVKQRKPCASKRPLVGAAAATAAAAAAKTCGVPSRVPQKFPVQSTGDTVKFRPDAGLPPFFAGDFWAMEMERMVRDIHKRLVARATGVGATKHGKARLAADVVELKLAKVEPQSVPVAPASSVPVVKASPAPASPPGPPNGSVLRSLFNGVSAALGVNTSPPSSPTHGASAATAVVPAAALATSSTPVTRSARAAPRGKQRESEPPKVVTNAMEVDETQPSLLRRGLAALGFGAAATSPTGNNGPSSTEEQSKESGSVGFAGAGSVLGTTLTPVPSAAIQLSADVLTRLPEHARTFLQASGIHYSPTGLSIRVGGELTVPSNPAAALAQRLRDMRREFMVVHLAPHRHAERAAHARSAQRNTTVGSDSTMSDVEDVEHAGDDMERLTRIPEDSDLLDDAVPARNRNRKLQARASRSHATIKVDTDQVMSTEPSGRRRRRRKADADSIPDSDETDANTETSAVHAAAAARATEAADAEADEQISCDFFDTRHGFLRMCQGNNYQFDTLRRAKHSSMMILWHLHNPSIPAYAHTCNMCEGDIGCGVRWHCETCFDFDICDTCHNNNNTHPHPLVALRESNVVVTTDGDTSPTSTSGTPLSASAPVSSTQPTCMVTRGPEASNASGPAGGHVTRRLVAV
jgi:hypothetical protein